MQSLMLIVTFIIVINFIINKLLKLMGYIPDPNILCCGIFGGSAKRGKKLNINKLNTLGLFNMSRGLDSAGYYYNGNLVKGIDDEASWNKLIAKHDIVSGDNDTEVFIGHTRKSTSGANTLGNAHPHMVKGYVQTHNGTLKDPWKLTALYGVDSSKIHVDSIGLAHIIEKDGFEVLNHYKGFAALAMLFTEKDPDALYLFHGASKDSAKSALWEERPLYMLKQPEGIYYSSLEESLAFINTTNAEVEYVPCNKVICIKNGKLTDFEYRVRREEANVPKTYVAAPAKTTTYTNTEETGTKQGVLIPDDVTKIGDAIAAAKAAALNETLALKNMVWFESYPPEAVEGNMYWRKGRAYRGRNILLNGEYLIGRGNKIMKVGEKSDKEVTAHYFIRGVMMTDKNAYDQALKNDGYLFTDMNVNFAMIISKYSRYPVALLECEGLNVPQEIRKLWYKDDKLVQNGFEFKYSNRLYRVKNGKLISMSSKIAGDKLYMKNSDQPKIDLVDVDTTVAAEDDMSPEMQEIIGSIMSFGHVNLHEEFIKDVPEYVLLFIDYYNRTFTPDLKSTDDTDMATTIVLKDMLTNKMSLFSYMKQFGDGDFLSEERIKKCFANVDLTALLKMFNRYEFIEFEIDPLLSGELDEAEEKISDVIDETLAEEERAEEERINRIAEEHENKEELEAEMEEENNLLIELERETTINLIERAKDQMAELIKIADELQALSLDDAAQDMAKTLYDAETNTIHTIKTIRKNEGYESINI